MVRSKCIVAMVLAALFFLGNVVPACAAKSSKALQKKSKPYRVSARSAILIEGGRAHVLFDKDSRRKVLPASTTKVMTALIVLEKMRLDDYVTVSKRAAAASPSKIDVKEGERYRVRDLLYAALLKSANDASVVLAEAVAGSEDRFVDLMNQRAKQLGAKHTLFANSHGLPSEDPQYTTAYDMARIFREAMKNLVFLEIIQKKSAVIKSAAGRKISIASHNKALFQGWKKDIYGKTGWTSAARACFVGYVTKNKKPMIVAVFGCSERWNDVKFIVERYGGVDL